MVGAQQFHHEAERIRQFQFLEIVMDGRGRIERQLERSASRIGELGQAFGVRLLAFIGQSDQRARETKRRSVESGRLIENPSLANVGWQALVRFCDRLPGIAVHLLSIGIGSDPLPQRHFVHHLAAHQRLVLQTGELAAINFQAILDAVQFILGAASLLFAHGHIFFEHRFAALQQTQNDRDARVAQLLKMGDRIQARG